MTNIISRWLGWNGKDKNQSTAQSLIEGLLEQLVNRTQLDVTFEVTGGDGDYLINIFGADQELFTERDGQLLDAIQLFLKRVVQHQLKDERLNIEIDCDGYREEANQHLIDLADRLKEMAMSKGKAVYVKPLPPRERKVVHQYLAQDERVKSRSIGDGLYKKIKIYPVADGLDRITS